MAALQSLRFDHDLRDAASTIHYFRGRAVQMLHDDHDWTWDGVVTPLVRAGVTWGAETILHDSTGAAFVSIYVFAGHRGRGHLRRHADARPRGQHYVTTPGCRIFDVLNHLDPGTRLAAKISGSPAYTALERRYGDTIAERSGLSWMNHIDEGLRILHRWLGAPQQTQQAWCLHPLVQGDDDLRRSWADGLLDNFDPAVVALALEYRNVANAFLSHMDDHPGFTDPARVTRSPLPGVDAMLVADKLQNCKDFRRHHATTHPRAPKLAHYFENWLTALNVDPAEVDRLDRECTVPPGVLGPPRDV